MISVVVNSLNEEEKLAQCLESVKDFADEIIVIDMESVDNTAQVAKNFKAKVYKHKEINYVEPVRSFGVSKAGGEWVMVLDPDEKMPGELKTELKEIALISGVAAVNIPRLNIIFGQKIKHTNFWPDKQIRFFRKHKVRFSSIIHSSPMVNGEVLDLPAKENLAIVHQSYKNVRDYWLRMQRYSDIESKNMYEKNKRFNLADLVYLPVYDFLRRYLRHLGFLDGWRGLCLSLLQAYYYILVELKLRKLDR